MLITDPTVNSFLHYFLENASVCLLNNHFVDKVSKKQPLIWKKMDFDSLSVQKIVGRNNGVLPNLLLREVEIIWENTNRF
nr:hypothetical protein [Providencia sp. R33]